MITALAGGVGAARFLLGLTKIVKEKELNIIVNTGDDIELFGLHISPDIDIVTYTLAGVVDEQKGWGINGDTFYCLEAMKKLGEEKWFAIGDRDLATHILRSKLLKQGRTLLQVTNTISRLFGLMFNIMPMTNDLFETRIATEQGKFHFQEYLVKREAKDVVLGVEFAGVNCARPSEGLIDTVLDSNVVVICPSNPIVSIGTILAIKGVRGALKSSNARKVAVSPIVAGAPIKGPADKLLKALGLEVSAYSIAKLYADFLDEFVIDIADLKEKKRIEELGIKVKVTNTIMRTIDDKVNLAKVVLDT